MAKAGYLTTVKKGGTPTSFTGEAATLVPGTTATYQINDLTKRVWDRNTVPTVKDGATTKTPIAIDYLFGKITLSAAATGAVTIGGKYMPVSAIGGANGYQLNQSSTVLDRTDYVNAQASNGHRSRHLGLHDVSLSVKRLDDLSKDFVTAITSGTPLLLEVRPGGSGDYFRGWMVAESDNRSGAIDDQEQSEVSFQLDGDKTTAFSWGQ